MESSIGPVAGEHRIRRCRALPCRDSDGGSHRFRQRLLSLRGCNCPVTVKIVFRSGTERLGRGLIGRTGRGRRVEPVAPTVSNDKDNRSTLGSVSSAARHMIASYCFAPSSRSQNSRSRSTGLDAAETLCTIRIVVLPGRSLRLSEATVREKSVAWRRRYAKQNAANRFAVIGCVRSMSLIAGSCFAAIRPVFFGVVSTDALH